MYTALSYTCAAATRELFTTPDLKIFKAIRTYLRKLSARPRLSSEADPMLGVFRPLRLKLSLCAGAPPPRRCRFRA